MKYSIPRTKQEIKLLSQQLSGRVHDLWLKLDDLDMPKAGEMICMPLRLEQTSDPTTFLRIGPVANVMIKDTEHIGFYDINNIEIDAAASRVIVRGNIPLLIDVRVMPNAVIDVE